MEASRRKLNRKFLQWRKEIESTKKKYKFDPEDARAYDYDETIPPVQKARREELLDLYKKVMEL